ncbi:MAG: zinc ribbon domain-containing protein [Lachnospiraceae bacterium]|nr:zinc ribbon domain-containing protein [Lachnospiraceae bacterium]
MYCPNCGKELPSESVFCVYCGSRLAQQAQVPPVTPPPVTEPAAPKSAKRGVLLAVIYFALGFLGILVNYGITALQMSSTGYFNGTVAAAYLSSALINLGMLIISMIAPVLVLIIRRKHLWKITGKDVLLVNIFAVIMWLAGYIQSIITMPFYGMIGSDAISAVSITNSALSMFGLSSIMNGIALALFILARTSAKKAVIILGSIAAFVMLLISAFQLLAPRLVFSLFTSISETERMAAGLIRVGAICNFLVVCCLFMLAACYGLASQTTKRWIPVYIISFAGKIVLGAALAALGVAVMHIGLTSYILVQIADAVVMIVCALIMLFGAIKNRRA